MTKNSKSIAKKQKLLQDSINIYGAKVHNLQNINVKIPRNKLVVFCGVSGSGKTSLAFDTIYAEAERRYVESLSSYARQFLGIKEKPDLEKIENLSPAISIDQRSLMKNPRSTVATITEIYDYLRVLFARIGLPVCPKCDIQITRQTASQISKQISSLPRGSHFYILAPIVQGKKGEHKGMLEEVYRLGYPRVRFDKTIWRTEELMNQEIDKQKKHDLEVIIDDIIIDKNLEKSRISDSVELGLKIGKGIIYVMFQNSKSQSLVFSELFACPKCGFSLPKIEPRLFSFNNPYGACPVCMGLGTINSVDPELVIPNKTLSIAEGAIIPWVRVSYRVGRQGYYFYELEKLADRLGFDINAPVSQLPDKILNIILYGDDTFEGVIPNLERRWRESTSDFAKQEIEKYMHHSICKACNGKRLKQEALSVLIDNKNIADILDFTIKDALKYFEDLKNKLNLKEKTIALPLLKEIIARLNFLNDISVEYLTLSRESTTLSGGEAQRIRLATQISSGLSGIIYVLDEPSVGLHPKDQERLINNLKQLKDLGNTIIVVEHDPQTILSADWVIEIGPGAGKNGGRVVFEGTPKDLLHSNTLTGQFLSGKLKVNLSNKTANRGADKFITINHANKFNLKNITVSFPLGKMIGITGVSGSGKSTLIIEVLYKGIINYFRSIGKIGYSNLDNDDISNGYKNIKGLENIDKIIMVDQSPIGRTPRSNPATYTGVFDQIRYIFSQAELARIRGYDQGRFSFNVKGGRCEVCEGQGFQKVEMYLLPDIYVPCEECHGTRFNSETLQVEYNGKNISEVLEMSVSEAKNFFKNIPSIVSKLDLLEQVGLGYIKLGQPATTLSGGEAQRVKLADELSKRDTGNTLYILDEPTTGLHFDDIKKLVNVLNLLVAKGNTVIIIEHEIDVIKSCDWIIELGPEGGDQGGKIVFEGTPENLKKNKQSYTAKFLK